jgi:hypothetical protein
MVEALPWLKDVNSKFISNDSFKKIRKSLMANLKESENLICFYDLNKKGQVKHIRIGVSSGNSNIDKETLALVKHVTKKLPIPPNNFASNKGLLVEFSKQYVQNDYTILVESHFR